MCLSLNKIVGCFWNGRKATEGWEKAVSLGSDAGILEGVSVIVGEYQRTWITPPHSWLLPSLNFGFTAQP